MAAVDGGCDGHEGLLVFGAELGFIDGNRVGCSDIGFMDEGLALEREVEGCEVGYDNGVVDVVVDGVIGGFVRSKVGGVEGVSEGNLDGMIDGVLVTARMQVFVSILVVWVNGFVKLEHVLMEPVCASVGDPVH